MTRDLKQWIADNFISYEKISYGMFKIEIEEGKYISFIEIEDLEDRSTFNEGMKLNIPDTVASLAVQMEIDNYVFKFGPDYFYSSIEDGENADLNLLRYIGKADTDIAPPYAFLGVHGRYERMNGTRDYKHWCEKANFLGVKALGICEKGTLAGTLPFQQACNKAGIKNIIGAGFDVRVTSSFSYEVKLYVSNHKGWRNLLRLNKYVNIDNDGQYITEDQLFDNQEGLILVLCPDRGVDEQLIRSVKKRFDNSYFQITTNEYKTDSVDRPLLESMYEYVHKGLPGVMEPILISDAYCLDYEDIHIKQILNQQGNVKERITENHYFKALDEEYDELELLFRADDNRFKQLFKLAIQNTVILYRKASAEEFEINVTERHLPVYEMTEEEEAKYGTTKEMFISLVGKGIQEKIDINKYDHEEVRDRVFKEIKVITEGGVHDYFLILWDIVNWCNEQKIQIGPGRGSAGGCLVAYALGITKLNPLDYGLLFERFLNEGRIKTELPDIDTDFASDRRDEVIEYMKERYGHDYVCRVGTYTTLQMRGAVKELARYYNAAPSHEMDKITKAISDLSETKFAARGVGKEWVDLFHDASTKRGSGLKEFMLKHPYIIHEARLVLNSIKSSSVHACATIIVPKYKDENGDELTIFDLIPTRKTEDGLLISEWEGDMMADAGFLKEDILSTKQMAKFGNILNLIEERYGERINDEDIPLDDQKTLKRFHEGYNQDVFHFGSEKLTGYLTQVVPYSIHELIAAIALYRPGAIKTKAHEKFIKRKFGEEEENHDRGLEEVTKDTYGLYVYQEQLMKAAQVMAGFDLVDADGLRKAIGKKIPEKMASYKQQFVDGAAERGYSEEEAEEVWKKIEAGASYSFNKSHAAAYSIIGYQCNWLKTHYPLEFWTVALQMNSDEKNIAKYISEIHKTGDIKISPPDINTSERKFTSDIDSKTIYWNLSSIKYVGDAAVDKILNDREENGKFFSMDEFNERVGGGPVNKRAVTNMILSGCFDDMYDITQVKDRFDIIEKYYESRKEEVPEELTCSSVDHDYWWGIEQYKLCGLGTIDYDKLINKHSIFSDDYGMYKDPEEFNDEENYESYSMIAGTIISVEERNSVNGPWAMVSIDNMYNVMRVQLWANCWSDPEEGSHWEGFRDKVLQGKGNILVMKGNVDGPCKYHPDTVLVADSRKTDLQYEIL